MTIINIEKWVSRFCLLVFFYMVYHVLVFLHNNPGFFEMFMKENFVFWKTLLTALK